MNEMRIYKSDTLQEACLVEDQDKKVKRYDCYLPDRPCNEKKYAHTFEKLSDAAQFLIAHPGSGIRMNPGFAIVSENVVIALY